MYTPTEKRSRRYAGSYNARFYLVTHIVGLPEMYGEYCLVDIALVHLWSPPHNHAWRSSVNKRRLGPVFCVISVIVHFFQRQFAPSAYSELSRARSANVPSKKLILKAD